VTVHGKKKNFWGGSVFSNFLRKKEEKDGDPPKLPNVFGEKEEECPSLCKGEKRNGMRAKEKREESVNRTKNTRTVAKKN